LHAETNTKNRNLITCILMVINNIIKYFECLFCRIGLVSFFVLNVIKRTRDKDSITFVKQFFHFFLWKIVFNRYYFASTLFDKFYIVKWNLLFIIVCNSFRLIHDIVDFVHNQSYNRLIVLF